MAIAKTSKDQITDEEVKTQLNLVVDGLYDYAVARFGQHVVREKSIHEILNWDRSGSTYSANSFQFIEWINKSNNFIWGEIVSGKYKGSIGKIAGYWLTGIYLIFDDDEESSKMTKKSLKLLPDYKGPSKRVVSSRVIKDIFDQTIENGDKVIYAERGKLHIGVLVEYDFHRNVAVMNTLDGKQEVNPRKSQIVNCRTINETFIANKVLMAKLKANGV